MMLADAADACAKIVVVSCYASVAVSLVWELEQKRVEDRKVLIFHPSGSAEREGKRF